MSYKQLSSDEGHADPGGSSADSGTLVDKSNPPDGEVISFVDGAKLGEGGEVELLVDEDANSGEEDHTLLIAVHSKQAGGGGKKGTQLLIADTLFERDTWRYRYTRRGLVVAGFSLLLGLVTASITLTVLSPGCPSSSLCSGERPLANDLLWWQKTIIYQAYPRSYQDSDGDGNGDLNGIRSRLDYLSGIGVGTLWLNPIYPSPGKDNGYDISNYTDIDPLYGDLKDFKDLLEDAHKKGLHVLLDFIPNHTSDEHPWFRESSRSRNNSKRDWYIWADGQDGDPPNNWVSVFGGSAWAYNNATDQYYYHAFGNFQPDLNYTNPEVLATMKDVLRFWLDLGVDGFRVDAAIFLLEDPQLRNETRNRTFPPGNCTTNITSRDCYNSLVHNLTTNYAGVHYVIRGWREVLDSYSRQGNERFMVGEVYDPVSEVVTYYDDQFDFPFNFILLTNYNWTGTAVSGLVSDWLDSVPQEAWSNWVLGNHDNSRTASKAGVYLARALNVLLLTLPGTPTTYYGEEILMTDVYVPPPERHDVSGEDRDKERTPMQWNTSANSGFTFPDSTPWLPLATNYSIYNTEVETSNSLSSLSLYRQLAQLRSTHPALQYTRYQHVYNSTEVFAYLRSANSSEILVVVNFSEREAKVDVSDGVKLEEPVVLLSSNLNRTGSISLSDVDLLGGEALLIKSSTDCF